MRETRRADQMEPGLRVRFPAGETVYAGTIVATRPVDARRIEFAFADAFRWTFLNSHLFHRERPDDEPGGSEEAAADRPTEFVADELAPMPA